MRKTMNAEKVTKFPKKYFSDYIFVKFATGENFVQKFLKCFSRGGGAREKTADLHMKWTTAGRVAFLIRNMFENVTPVDKNLHLLVLRSGQKF